jgi:hypothetical protein
VFLFLFLPFVLETEVGSGREAIDNVLFFREISLNSSTLSPIVQNEYVTVIYFQRHMLPRVYYVQINQKDPKQLSPEPSPHAFP